jgi:hypothetical protein
MDGPVPARHRVVEVIADLGNGQTPRWRYGSGLLLGDRQVLTCAHVVAGSVRVEIRRPDKVLLEANIGLALIGQPAANGFDLAILQVPEADELPHVPVALVNRDVAAGVFLEGCSAVGYPAFQEISQQADGPSIRESAQVRGSIAPLSGLVSGLLSLEVTSSPRDLPAAATTLAQSAWSGMSGAAVFAPQSRAAGGEVLLGVVVEHSLRRGQSDITVLPLDRLIVAATAPVDASEWWRRLGVADPKSLPLLPMTVPAHLPRRHNVPELPPHFLSRSESVAALTTAVLSDQDRVTGLLGMGGIGKSVMAATVARDEKVAREFTDGVIWVTLGQHVDALTIQKRQAEIVMALNDPQRPIADIHQGKAVLSALLQDKRCLLVLDDAWRVEDIAAFGTRGPLCRMLVTTRDGALLTNIGAAIHRLGVLTQDQASTLLAEWAGQTPESLPQSAAEVTRECGNLPLALAMVGAMIRGKPDRWNNVLHKLRTQSLEQIGREFPNYPYPNLFRAIQVSVDSLEPEELRNRYYDFSVFQRSAAIPTTALETFWKPLGMDTYDVQDTVDTLVDRSLLQRASDGSLRMHDLQLDYVQKRAGETVTLHERLLEAYREAGSSDWLAVTNDGYFFENLSYHLVAAGRTGELDELLGRESADGENAWYVRLNSIDPSGALYLRDVMRAWEAVEAADRMVKEQKECPHLVREVQYALATSSVHSRSSNIPLTLLVMLLEDRIWTLDQALAGARQIPAPRGRVDALRAIAATRQEPQRSEIYREALDLVRKTSGTPEPVISKEVFGQLVAELPAVLLEDARVVARSFSDPVDRCETLLSVARRLPEPIRDAALLEAVAATRAVTDGEDVIGPGVERASALLSLADGLPEPLRAEVVDEALAIARTMDAGDSWRARTLADVAARLPESRKIEIVREALEAAHAIPVPAVDRKEGEIHWMPARGMALTEIAPLLPIDLLEQAIGIAGEFADARDRDNVAAALAAHLAKIGEPGKALAVIGSVGRGRHRDDALAEVAAHSSSATELRDVLEAARGLKPSTLSRVAALVGPRLARLGLYDDSLTVAHLASRPAHRVEAFVNLSEVLPEPLKHAAVEEALKAARSNKFQTRIADRIGEIADEPLMQLALHASRASDLDTAFAAVRVFPRQGARGGIGPRADALTLLATHLPKELRADVLLEALSAAQVVGDLCHRARLIGAWAHANVGTDTAPSVLDSFRRVLSDLAMLANEEQRRVTLVDLLPHIPASLLDAAATVARGIEGAKHRAIALAKVAVCSGGPARELLLAEALEAIKANNTVGDVAPTLMAVIADFSEADQRYLLETMLDQEPRIRIRVVPNICPFLPDNLQRQALAAAWRFEDTDERLQTLLVLGKVLSEAEQREVVAMIRTLADAEAVANALALLSPSITQSLLSEVLEIARAIGDEDSRATVFAVLAPRLVAAGRSDEAMELLGQFTWEANNTSSADLGSNMWAHALATTTAILPAGERPEVPAEIIDAARAIPQAGVRARVLCALSLLLSETALQEIMDSELQKLKNVEEGDECSEALIAIAPYLPDRMLSSAVAVARVIPDSTYLYVSPRANALAALASRLQTLPPAILGPIWRDTLHALASHPRGDLLWDLSALSAIPKRLCGARAAIELTGVLDCVQRWWP